MGQSPRQPRPTRRAPPTTAHDLRHSFTSFAAARGSSLYVIGKALGLTQASMTQRYAHLSDDAGKCAAETVADQILGTGMG